MQVIHRSENVQNSFAISFSGFFFLHKWKETSLFVCCRGASGFVGQYGNALFFLPMRLRLHFSSRS